MGRSIEVADWQGALLGSAFTSAHPTWGSMARFRGGSLVWFSYASLLQAPQKPGYHRIREGRAWTSETRVASQNAYSATTLSRTSPL